ncbi:uncharacterized protein OCT59_004902 [Rhizophagus irregularis]|uniref:Uncharacterized protein n=1 Tax=Rhizophagus irregularis TaxID=588596 RepID=A0A2N1MGY8_9GLOM|nr:hypothetical protein RhiirC2_232910 [Rhizophagus irregularis]GBC21706.2 hypothetical protein GLOIN_2v1511629 [Rhizophagus irregularis DAOM 181602=DAOM 197198]UZO13403.1 hypothetical protein OCT59_004902 [Rhizophagus irregularis]CAB4393442.1 unnamed protein product [Rhizophagus irregularis]CAB4473909.1 unnamed protein product [Rhizophagus irregularis]
MTVMDSTSIKIWYSQLHSLEKNLFFIIMCYAIISISSSVGLLLLQFNSIMNISWLFYLFVLGLVTASFITFTSRSLLYFTVFTMTNSVSILIYFVLIQFVNDVCESLVCIKHIRFIKQTAFVLFIFSILFELNFIFFGYAIWVKRVWRQSHDYRKLYV